MTDYSITVISNDSTIIPIEVEQKFKNRDKTSSKRVNYNGKPLTDNLFIKNVKNKTSTSINPVYQKCCSDKSPLQAKKTSSSNNIKLFKDKGKSEKQSIYFNKDKVNEIDSIVISCIKNGYEFEKTFDYLENNNLISQNGNEFSLESALASPYDCKIKRNILDKTSSDNVEIKNWNLKSYSPMNNSNNICKNNIMPKNKEVGFSNNVKLIQYSESNAVKHNNLLDHNYNCNSNKNNYTTQNKYKKNYLTSNLINTPNINTSTTNSSKDIENKNNLASEDEI